MATFLQAERAETLFSRLFEKHRKGLYAYSLGQFGEVEAAADCLQEAYLRLWKHISKVDSMDEDHQVRWLYTTTKNCIADARRRAKLRSSVPLSSAPEIAIQGDQEQLAIADETLNEITQAITKLPLELRTILSMSVLGEMNSQQIGTVLSKPPGTVRYQLSCARTLLMADLSGKMNDGSGQ